MQLKNDFTKDSKNSSNAPPSLPEMIREIRERNENDSWRSARHNRPPDRAAVPLFLPLSVNRVKRGAPSFPSLPLFPFSRRGASSERRSVPLASFRIRPRLANCQKQRSVCSYRCRERERKEEDCDLFRKRRSVGRGEVFRREGKGVVVQRA